MAWYRRWEPYVPVKNRIATSMRRAKAIAKKRGRELSPVHIEGRKICHSFWGQAWCDNLAAYSDYENRLARGGRYVRNGSVIDLQIESGVIQALVSGSTLYRVKVEIKTLAKASWTRIKQDCSRSIDSLLDLLKGTFDEGVMKRLTEPDGGLFPHPDHITMTCTCPDSAWLCKHIAAVLYGVGARLDVSPELLFTLRKVDHRELIRHAAAAENLQRTLAAGPKSTLSRTDLGELFGIEIDHRGASAAVPSLPPATRQPSIRRRKKSAPAKPADKSARGANPGNTAQQSTSRKRATKRRKTKPANTRSRTSLRAAT